MKKLAMGLAVAVVLFGSTAFGAEDVDQDLARLLHASFSRSADLRWF